jgi:hypothetical protein
MRIHTLQDGERRTELIRRILHISTTTGETHTDAYQWMAELVSYGAAHPPQARVSQVCCFCLAHTLY